MTSIARLYGLTYSPWTERARWALAHHGVNVDFHEHVPLLGEWLLRRRARARPGERVSVPLLVVGDRIVRESADIIRYADEVGRGTPLIDNDARFTRVVAVVETFLQATRARVALRVLADREAQREAAMVAVPALFAGLLRPLSRRGARFLVDKHGGGAPTIAACEDLQRQALDEVIPLVLGAAPYGTTSPLRAVDIVLASALQGIDPARGVPHLRLRPATERAWRADSLVERYLDVLTWRDARYQARDVSPP